MSLFDDEPRDPRAAEARPSSRGRAIVITAIVLSVAFLSLTTFAAVFTDHLWFDRIGYSGVFSTLLWTRLGLFAVFGVLMALVVAGTIWLAYRSRPIFGLGAFDSSGLERYRDAVTPIRAWLLVGVSLVIGAFAGSSAMGGWRAYVMWRNGGSFGEKDPYFHKDIGFFVFDLPWWHFVVGFVMAAAVVGLLVCVTVHYLYGGIRLQAPRDRISGPAQVQLSVLLGVFVLAKAADYWLDRYDLVHGSGQMFTGIGYTDDHALLPAKSILMWIALICAVLFFVNVLRRTWLLPSVGLALMVVSAILLGMIWPAIVQGFQVRPSPDKEISYLAKNIEQTRKAFNIDDDHVEVQAYTADADAGVGEAKQLDAATSSVPLVDPQLVRQLFDESQQARGYYKVGGVLDVDHYEMDGKDRALVLGVRELDQNGIDASDRNWTNLHTVYTHGSGVIAAYANHRDITDKRESLDVQWAQGNEPDQDDLVTAGPGKFEERVYFGEDSPRYSIVGRPQGAQPVEVDLAGQTGAEDEDRSRTYDGEGGVPIGSNFRQLLYALKFNSANFLLSERVGSSSQVIYNRTPKERVEKVAPWLTLDDDAYPVVADGRIQWVLDGYTTTDRFPGSQRESFRDMTDDALQSDLGPRTLPTDQINYMRNAVKATVDAYDGTVNLYAWDESDPILKAWRKVFPGTVQPKAKIPSALLEHLRYPEDMFKVQRYQLAKYHVTDPDTFREGSERWKVPEDPNNKGHLQPPYRMFVGEPAGSGGSGGSGGSDGSAAGGGETSRDVWSLTSAYVPNARNNLAAVVTVNSDATTADYGRIRVLERTDQQTQGPAQVSQAMQANAKVAEALLPYKDRTSFGNLLTVPTSQHGLMFIEPVYAIKATATSPYPTLVFVVVSYNGRVGHGATLQSAIEAALRAPADDSGTGTTTPPEPSASPSGSPSSRPTLPPGSADEQVATLLSDAESLFRQADEAGKSGDFTRREQLLKEARDKVAQAAGLLGQ